MWGILTIEKGKEFLLSYIVQIKAPSLMLISKLWKVVILPRCFRYI